MRALNEIVSGTKEFREGGSQGNLIRLPMGDGMALVFRSKPEALAQCAMEISQSDRPIFARAAMDNIGSIRVLQKCGFKIFGTNKDFANCRGEETEEYILRLDLDQASE